MKISRLLTLGLLLIAGAGAYGQTKLVAHRSHSGSLASYSPNGAGNFGEFAHKRVARVIRLTDSTALEVSNEGADTTRNHPYWNNPKVGLDSLRKTFPDISFEGYDKAGAPVAEVTMPKNAGTNGGILSLTLLGSTVVLLVAGGIWQSQKYRGS